MAAGRGASQVNRARSGSAEELAMAVTAGKRRVIFSLAAPDASEVYLCGSFNDWDPMRTPMKRNGDGSWKAQVMLPPGTYQYRVRVDGEWADDPGAEERIPN